MNVPFDFFFGILGLVAGMVIVWLLESRRAFEPNEEPWELPDPIEPAFIASELAKRGRPIDEDTVTEVLEMHLAYLDGRADEEKARTDRLALARARRELAADRGPADGGSADGGPADELPATQDAAGIEEGGTVADTAAEDGGLEESAVNEDAADPGAVEGVAKE